MVLKLLKCVANELRSIGILVAVTFSSGQAAIASVFQCCSARDHIIFVQAISGDTDWLLKNKLPVFGIPFDEVCSRDTQDIISFINERTKVIPFKHYQCNASVMLI